MPCGARAGTLARWRAGSWPRPDGPVPRRAQRAEGMFADGRGAWAAVYRAPAAHGLCFRGH